MPNKLAHFAIEADDVNRAKSFYESVFGWAFNPWGPPDFYQIQDAGLHGALQQRREPMPSGRKGMELTFAVDDLDDSRKLVLSSGGSISSEVFTIPTVGQLLEVMDTEGNVLLLMQYEPEKRLEMGL